MKKRQREIARQPGFRTPAERETWEPILRSAAEAWQEIELASIGVLRTSGFVWIEANDLCEASMAAHCSGLLLTPIYRNRERFRCVIGKDDPNGWSHAWRENDNRAIGELLGYPECCVEWFEQYWVREGRQDWITPEWMTAPWQLNQIPMRLDIRLTPWVPCGPTCKESLERAKLFLELGRRIGADVDSLTTLLKMPYTWDALHGAAIVHGGGFRFVHDTDPETTGKLVYEGEPVVPYAPWKNNGFKSHASQRKAHEFLERYTRERGEPGVVLDLGCGNGDLLARFGAGGIGVECDEARWQDGAKRHPDLRLIRGQMEDTDSWAGLKFDTVLIAPQRLLELKGPKAHMVRFALRLAKRIIAYSWDGEKILDLCERTQLRQAWTATGDGHNEAMEVTV